MPDLLANVIVDTYSGFSDVTTSLSGDVRAHRFLPLSALLKKSVSAPLLAQWVIRHNQNIKRLIRDYWCLQTPLHACDVTTSWLENMIIAIHCDSVYANFGFLKTDLQITRINKDSIRCHWAIVITHVAVAKFKIKVIAQCQRSLWRDSNHTLCWNALLGAYVCECPNRKRDFRLFM